MTNILLGLILLLLMGLTGVIVFAFKKGKRIINLFIEKVSLLNETIEGLNPSKRIDNTSMRLISKEVYRRQQFISVLIEAVSDAVAVGIGKSFGKGGSRKGYRTGG